MHLYLKTIEELRAEYKAELSKTPYKEPSRHAAFAYDAVWTIALTLHNSISALQQQNETRNMSLEDFDYNNTAMRKTFMKVAKGVSFQGMSVSALLYLSLRSPAFCFLEGQTPLLGTVIVRKQRRYTINP